MLLLTGTPWRLWKRLWMRTLKKDFRSLKRLL
jgi:hypothetical protein